MVLNTRPERWTDWYGDLIGSQKVCADLLDTAQDQGNHTGELLIQDILRSELKWVTQYDGLYVASQS